MALEDFIAREVAPGEPLTAQAWNDIVRATADLISTVQGLSGSVLEVVIANADVDPAQARVTALGADGGAVEAARPIKPKGPFILTNLTPGPYTIRASAPGFGTATTTVTAPSATTVELALERSQPRMPSVFGEVLPVALDLLKEEGIAVSRVIDATGREVAPANPDPDYRDTPVLMQLPVAGEPVSSKTGAQLVVAASVKVEPSVEVPSLTGLTLDEARQVLDDLGLVLGKVTTKR
jgi:hypothetical protein